MRATLMKETLKDMHKILRPVVITGAPGGGKTQIVQQVAKELGVHYIQRHLPTMPVEDFGIPMIDRPQLYYKIPDWFPAVGSETYQKNVSCMVSRWQMVGILCLLATDRQTEQVLPRF